MILKGNQRGGGKQLALHLLNQQDNEHVHVHDMRGFVADDLPSAFHESYAISRGTRARQFLFSLSLNPPVGAKVSTEDFEKAIASVEDKLGLQDQPRAIVFHEKEGRRHAHAVWSRIDAGAMKAINLPHYKLKLRDVSRALYLEHGWQMPRGLVNSKERDPANFTHAEWQQARRGDHDPKALKEMFQDCWAMSDSRQAFAQALKARGYTLARGDRRGHVAVDYRGEVYAVAKFIGVRTSDVKARLGDADDLPGVAQAKQEIADRMTKALRRHIQDARASHRQQSAALALRKADMVQRQRDQRARLERAQAERWTRETQDRAKRLSTGLRGLWDRVTGRQGRIERQNAVETLQAYQRDRSEKDRLIFGQIDERQDLHETIKDARRRQARQVVALHREIAGYAEMKDHAVSAERESLDLRRTPTLERAPRGSRRGKDFGREM